MRRDMHGMQRRIHLEPSLVGFLGHFTVESRLLSGGCVDLHSSKPTAKAPENSDGWKTIHFRLGPAYFQGRAISFRECKR